MSTHVREAFVTLPRCRSSSVRFERSRGHRSFAGSTFVQRRAADQPVRSACLWRLRELPEATSSHRCGDDAPSAASGMIADQFTMKLNRLLNVTALLPVILSEPGLNSELRFDKVTPRLAFFIKLVVNAESLI